MPIVLLVQGDERRRELKATLTREGVLAALKSKNAIVNTLVAGELLADGLPITGAVSENPSLGFHDGPSIQEPLFDPQPEATWARIFDLTNYEINDTNYNFSEEVYILGVEADATDGLSDGKHDYHWVDTDIALGMALTGHPPHRSARAELPHTVLTSNADVQSARWDKGAESSASVASVC